VVERGHEDAAVPGHVLQASALRSVFQAPRPWSPEVTDEARWFGEVTPTPAAVLISLIDGGADGLSVMLTRRTAHLHDHAGQIAFPGGRVDVDDANRVDTALREAREEVGLPGHAIEIIGTMPEYVTGTGFSVTPVVGLVHEPVQWQPDPFEVAEVFSTPLSFLMNPANHERREVHWTDQHTEFVRHFYAMPYSTSAGHYFIWGATAAMLRNLYHFLRAQA